MHCTKQEKGVVHSHQVPVLPVNPANQTASQIEFKKAQEVVNKSFRSITVLDDSKWQHGASLFVAEFKDMFPREEFDGQVLTKMYLDFMKGRQEIFNSKPPQDEKVELYRTVNRQFNSSIYNLLGAVNFEKWKEINMKKAQEYKQSRALISKNRKPHVHSENCKH